MAIKRKLRNPVTPTDPQAEAAPQQAQQEQQEATPQDESISSPEQSSTSAIGTTTSKRGRPRKPSLKAIDASISIMASELPAKSRKRTKVVKTKATPSESDPIPTEPVHRTGNQTKHVKEPASPVQIGGNGTTAGAGQFFEFRIDNLVPLPPSIPQKNSFPVDVTPSPPIPPPSTHHDAIIVPSDIPAYHSRSGHHHHHHKDKEHKEHHESRIKNRPRRWNRRKVVIKTTGGEIAVPLWYSTEQRQLMNNPRMAV